MRGGRPCGFLAAWLEAADGALEGDRKAGKKMHMDLAFRAQPLEAREAMRQELKQTAEGRALLSKERPKESGENSEPEDLDAYI